MILVDTSVFVASVATRDAHHSEAVALLRQHGAGGLVTTNHVRGETWTFLNRRYGHHTAVAFLEMLDVSRVIEVVTIGDELEHQALRWLRRHDEREYSFVDATSFALMRTTRGSRALTFDADFAAAGFAMLRG